MGDFRDDLRIRRGALRHPKLVLLRRKHGAEAVLSLIALWDHAAGSRWNGDLSGMTDEEIEAAADWGGEPGAWIKGAAALRCIDGEPGSRSIHGWAEAQPWIYHREDRLATAKKKGRAGGLASAKLRVPHKKAKGTLESTLQEIEPPTPKPSPTPTPTPTPTPAPTPTLQESPSDSCPPSGGREGWRVLIEAWNQETDGVLPAVRTVTKGSKRERVLIEAWRACSDLGRWREAFRAIATSTHHQGGNDRGWKADIDFACRKDQRDRWLDAGQNGHDQLPNPFANLSEYRD